MSSDAYQAVTVPRGVFAPTRTAPTPGPPSPPSSTPSVPLATAIVGRVGAVLHVLDATPIPAAAAIRALAAGMCEVAAYLVAATGERDAGWRQAVYGVTQATHAGAEAVELLRAGGTDELTIAVAALAALTEPAVDALTGEPVAVPVTPLRLPSQAAPAPSQARRQPWWGSR